MVRYTSRIAFAPLITIATACILLVACPAASVAEPAAISIADLDAFHVVPPTESLGTAHLDIQTLTMDPPRLRLLIRADYLSGPIVIARIHRGVVGENGPVVFDLGTFTGARMVDWLPTAQDISDLEAGLLYVEARGQDYPRDEIRGQIHALDAAPCDRCGPGAHWIHSPGCPQGTSTTPVVVDLTLDLDRDCEADTALILLGPGSVQRSRPRDDSVYFPGSTPVDGHLSLIDTEVTALSAIHGDDALVCGSRLGAIQLDPSFGIVAEREGDPTIAESFFDLTFELRTGGLVLYNQSPVRLSADVSCLPPRVFYDGVSGCTPLFTSPIPGEGEHLANLMTMSLSTFLEPAGMEEGDLVATNGEGAGALREITPNPTSGIVSCTIEMRRSARATVKLYDVAGRALAVMLDRTLEPGIHRFTWNAASCPAGRLATGAYLLCLDAGGSAQTRKLVIR